MAGSLKEIAERHSRGGGIVDTIEAAYAAADAYADPALFLAMRPREEAVELARKLQAEGARGRPLYGVPFAVKDNIDVAGLPTTAACPAFAYRPERSAFAVERLEAAGAIAIGKTNLDQFATGLVGVRSPYGTPRNALRADLIPGGSSSGSAVAVAAGITPFSLGTDTAGSGRVPAALNGIVGLKPSLGALSTTGVVPACRTLDTISIFALSVEDAFTAFQAAAGFDTTDAYSRRRPAPRFAATPPHFRLGAPRGQQRQFFGDAAAERAYVADLEQLAGLGAEIVEFDIEPFYEVARLLYEGPWVAERYAATQRLIESQPDAFHPVTRKIIEGARNFNAVSTFEAIYRLAALRRACEPAWELFDAMALPTMPRVYTKAEVEADPISTNSNLGTYTNFVNLLDLSAIAYPSGMRGDGLPSSITLVGKDGADGFLAGIAMRAHAASGAPMGATTRAAPHAQAGEKANDRIELAVVGAHLSGLPLNGELVALGAQFVREALTTSDYRLFALPNTTPAKPGLLRVAPGEGGAIAVEIWSLTAAAFGAFVAAIPSPLGIGTLAFSDGASAKGFLVEAEAVKGARDVTSFGGWRGFVTAK